MIHSVVSSTSALSAKESLPSIVTPPSAGALTSTITFLSLAMATVSPAAGTLLLGQVAGSDHWVALAGAPAFWAWTTANTPPSRTAGTSDARRTERDRAPMAITPSFSELSPSVRGSRIARLSIARPYVHACASIDSLVHGVNVTGDRTLNRNATQNREDVARTKLLFRVCPRFSHSISTSRKIDFERTIRRTKKPPARRRGLCSAREKDPIC